MEYKIILKKEAAKYLASLDKPTRTRLKKAIQGLLINPPDGDIVPLKGKEDLLRLRVGTFRIIFQKNNMKELIIIETIAPRGDVYK